MIYLSPNKFIYLSLSNNSLIQPSAKKIPIPSKLADRFFLPLMYLDLDDFGHTA